MSIIITTIRTPAIAPRTIASMLSPTAAVATAATFSGVVRVTAGVVTGRGEPPIVGKIISICFECSLGGSPSSSTDMRRE